MEEVGLRKGRGDLGSQGGSFLCDALQLPPESGDFVKWSLGGGVALSCRGVRERVSQKQDGTPNHR